MIVISFWVILISFFHIDIISISSCFVLENSPWGNRGLGNFLARTPGKCVHKKLRKAQKSSEKLTKWCWALCQRRQSIKFREVPERNGDLEMFWTKLRHIQTDFVLEFLLSPAEVHAKSSLLHSSHQLERQLFPAKGQAHSSIIKIIRIIRAWRTNLSEGPFPWWDN